MTMTLTEPLVIERILSAPVEKVFEFITQRDNLLKWWGPEGMTVPEETLDFRRTGSWHSVMMSAEGNRFKVSGEVTEVKAPNLVAFTWGWHDEDDARGHESHVRLEVSAHGEGKTKLVLRHSELADDESAQNHEMGWTSSLKKLERAFA